MQSTKNETNIQKQIQHSDILYAYLCMYFICFVFIKPSPFVLNRRVAAIGVAQDDFPEIQSGPFVGGVPAPTSPDRDSWCGVYQLSL